MVTNYMNVRIIRKGTDCYLQLPPEFSQTEEAELFKLKDGYYLISLPLGKSVQEKPAQEKQVQQNQTAPTSEEKEVLRKLSAIKFENRTPKQIMQSFSANERTMLSQMEKKGFVQLYKGGKYKDGVYSIPDKVYPLLKETSPTLATPKTASPLDPFFKQGFIVFANNNDAASFSDLLKKTRNSLNILGIKGFDGKFYVVTKDYMIDLSGKIRVVLKGNNTMTSSMIAKACNAEDAGCRAVLLLMAEKGDVLEKKKDIFVLV